MMMKKRKTRRNRFEDWGEKIIFCKKYTIVVVLFGFIMEKRRKKTGLTNFHKQLEICHVCVCIWGKVRRERMGERGKKKGLNLVYTFSFVNSNVLQMLQAKIEYFCFCFFCFGNLFSILFFYKKIKTLKAF